MGGESRRPRMGSFAARAQIAARRSSGGCSSACCVGPVECCSPPPPDALELLQIEGIKVEGIVGAGVRMALFSEHLSAFVALCILLNRQSQFSGSSELSVGDRVLVGGCG